LANLIKNGFDIAQLGGSTRHMAKAKQIDIKSECMFTTALKIARVAGVSDPTPLNWFKSGKLPGVKIGNVVRFPIAEVAAILGIKPEALLPVEGGRP